MHELVYMAATLHQHQEARHAARAPQMVAYRELELLRTSAATAQRSKRPLRPLVAWATARRSSTTSAEVRPALSR